MKGKNGGQRLEVEDNIKNLCFWFLRWRTWRTNGPNGGRLRPMGCGQSQFVTSLDGLAFVKSIIKLTQ